MGGGSVQLAKCYDTNGTNCTDLADWHAGPWVGSHHRLLASIQEKREASSEVLVDDCRQIRHDKEEDRDQTGRHAEAG